MSLETYDGGYVISVGGATYARPSRVDRQLAGVPASSGRSLATRAPRPAPAPGPTVTGYVIPYGVELDTGEGHELFTRETRWDDDPSFVPLRLEHSGWLGHGAVVETAGGLYFSGTVDGHFARSVANRRELSAKFDVLASHRRADGVAVIDHARLLEVSLVRHARLAPLTAAVVR